MGTSVLVNFNSRESEDTILRRDGKVGDCRKVTIVVGCHIVIVTSVWMGRYLTQNPEFVSVPQKFEKNSIWDVQQPSKF